MKKRLLPIVGCLALLPLSSCGGIKMVNVLKGNYKAKYKPVEEFPEWVEKNFYNALYFDTIIKDPKILADEILYTFSSSFKEAGEVIQTQFDYSKFKMGVKLVYADDVSAPTLKLKADVAGECKNASIGISNFDLSMSAKYTLFDGPYFYGDTGTTEVGRCAYALTDCYAMVIKPNNVEVSVDGDFTYNNKEISIDKTESYTSSQLLSQIQYSDDTQAMYVFYYTFAYLPQISLLSKATDKPNRLFFASNYYKNARPY